MALQISAQVSNINGNVASDTAELTILNIYPDSFPDVSVIFRAETKSGHPCWNLTKDKVRVQENGQDCEVISIEPISKNRPVNLGVVIDHSGSMAYDGSLFIDTTLSFGYIDSVLADPTYKSPLQNAQEAVKTFISGFDRKKDFVSVVGFSSAVTPIIPLTQDIGVLNAAVDSMKPDGSTALYDAMVAGLNELKDPEQLRVLIVLTDGSNNASTSTWKDVIRKALESKIPIYVIGFGSVNRDTLSMIADSTQGRFYYSSTSATLMEAYDDIRKHILAFYDLKYRSPNLASADSLREIRIWFETDSMSVEAAIASASLPDEVILYLEQKEKERSYYLYGGIAVVGLIAFGTLLYRYNRRPKEKQKIPAIINLFPNPNDGNFAVEYDGDPGKIEVMNLKGQIVKEAQISSGITNFSFSDLNSGNYIVFVITGAQRTSAVKLVVNR